LPEAERRRFKQWVNRLVPPAALVLTDDYDAGILMEVCREAGLEIPRDVSMLSIGSHGSWTPPCPVPLSAVEPDDDRQMEQMLALLRRQARGLPLRQTILEIPFKGVCERESTRDGHVNDHAVGTPSIISAPTRKSGSRSPIWPKPRSCRESLWSAGSSGPPAGHRASI
jgi:hypothetical protein